LHELTTRVLIVVAAAVAVIAIKQVRQKYIYGVVLELCVPVNNVRGSVRDYDPFPGSNNVDTRQTSTGYREIV